jgi:single-stranded DNA-binding protein
MTNDLVLTITGNLTADPELNHTRGGTPVATLIVATTPRHYDRAADMWADERNHLPALHRVAAHRPEHRGLPAQG